MKVSSLKRKAKQPPTATRVSVRLVAEALATLWIRQTKAKRKTLHSIIVTVAKISEIFLQVVQQEQKIISKKLSPPPLPREAPATTTIEAVPI